MKKTMTLALLLVICLMLGACGGQNAAPSSSPPPTPSGEPALTPEPADQPYSYYPVFERIEELYVGGGYGDEPAYLLSDDERSQLWLLMRVDDWVVASDLPIGGFSSKFYILEGDQTWYFNAYAGGDKTLIVPGAPDPNGEKTCYFAPIDVITDILAYTETLTPFSDQ